jgi:hypothetical protein
MLALSGSGAGTGAIAHLTGCSSRTVSRWLKRGAQAEDLHDLRRQGCPAVYTEDVALKVVAFYCQAQPLPGCGRWTLRWATAWLAAHAGQAGASPSKSTIHRILAANKLKPHLSRYFLHISDPDFFPKMEHLVALYANPPPNLFFFDECPGIQVLKRLTPSMQTEGMKARLEEFEYIRNGTTDVFAFLNFADGKVFAECHARHDTATFLKVFSSHVAQAEAVGQLHYVTDNLACHRGYPFCQLVAELSGVTCPTEIQLDSQDKRAEWLRSEDKRIVIHFTPYHGSWLNLVEIWFGIMGGKVLAESFADPAALKTAFDAFVEQWNCLLAHPFRWTYDGSGLCEKCVKRFTQLLLHSVDQMDMRILSNMLMLMANLLNNRFHNVPELVWRQLAEAAESQCEIMASLIAHEDGPLRKKKAEEALLIFNAALMDKVKPNVSSAA